MKKFLKSKIDENETTNQKASEAASDPVPIQVIVPKLVKEEKAPAPSIHPPLPLDPPPADSPPKPKLTVKEKKDILKNPDNNDEKFNMEKMIKNIKTENEADEQPKSSKPTVCRDFIRGTCTRPTTCKYAHDRDLSQLKGVYTFCHNFQNSVCTHPHCRYVHATIFEEQTFYRTGVLPPHSIAHHKGKQPQTKLFPPPPPPPPENNEDSHSQPIDANSSMEKPLIPCLPPANVMPVNNIKQQHNFVDHPPGNPPWAGHNNFVGSPRALEADKPPECDTCMLMENRLSHTKAKVEMMKKPIAENDKELALLEKKEKRLNAVIQLLLQPKTNQQQQGEPPNNNPVKDMLGNHNSRPPRAL